MNITLWIGLGVAAYFAGAVPFALVVSKMKGVDLRSVGSGNIGATNVYRAMGLPFALLVFSLDAVKGLLPTLIARLLFPELPMLHIGVGILAVVGHTLTVFAGFKGGKGAATGLGVLLALNPVVFGITAVIAAAIIGGVRYVSVATITCSLLVPVLMVVFRDPIEYISFTILVCAFIIYRHKANIVRLLKGSENKV